MLGGMRQYVRALTPRQRGAVAAIVNACAWTLVYFLFLRTPLPVGWTFRAAEFACLAAGVVGGALACMTSRRLGPVALGAGAGIILGGAEAVVSDVSISHWQRVTSGLVLAPLPLYLWLTIVASWVGVSLALRRWPVPQMAASTPTRDDEGRRTTG
jgi:hypothetical protein